MNHILAIVVSIVNLRILSIGCLLTLCGLSLPASAVIVAGASGGGNTTNNTTETEYFAETGTSLNVYNHVVQFGGGSGAYLGYNATTKEVWVLTARHISVGGAPTVTIDGLSYNYQSDSIVGDGDLRVVKYKRDDNQVPGLTALSLSNTIPTASTSLVMIGYGRNRTENAAINAGDNDSTSTGVGTGYHWTEPRIMRWGTNVVEGEFLDGLESTGPQVGVMGNFNMGGYDSTGFMTDFDEPTGGQWLASNEAQGSIGDSGGGIFIYDGGQWVLSGLMSAVAGYGGQEANTSAFGNYTLITDISTYRSAIDAAIGVTLIPEPSVATLLATIGTLALLRRRRAPTSRG